MEKKLEALVEKKKKEMDMIYYERYGPLFQDAFRFLSHKKALMYGGTALNELLPVSLKFYEPYVLPDIDVLSPSAETLAREMVRFYKKKKHQAVSFTEALHPGTFKVYADGVQIADITQCSPSTYRTLRKQSVVVKGVKVAPVPYLRMTLHKLLSQPNDAHRWKNVYERLERFYKTFPVSCFFKKQSSYKQMRPPEELFQQIRETMPSDTVFMGKKEIELLLEKPIPSFLPPLLMLTTEDLFSLSLVLSKEFPGLSISPIYPPDDFLPPHIALFYRNLPIGIVFHLSSCIAYTIYKNQRIGSIHTMLDFILSMSLSSQPHFKKIRPWLECLADELTRVQQKPSHRKVLNPLVMECYGPSVGLATMRRQRAKRLYKKRKLSIYP